MKSSGGVRLSGLKPRILPRLAGIDAAAWNALGGVAHPFLRHEFLDAMETQGYPSPRVGWIPHHLLVEGGNNRMVAACPMYRKFNSLQTYIAELDARPPFKSR
jgi:predicted N-acyltransferase